MYRKAVNLTDNWTGITLNRQELDPGSKYYGGVIDESGIALANHRGTPSIMISWTASLLNPDSVYYRDLMLLNRLELAADFMLNRQHPDGTISPGWTNYNSPPDTGFVINCYTLIYRMLQAGGFEDVNPVAAKVKLFLERTIPAMLTGGCHTPNHRWVMVAALAQLHDIFPRPELILRADEWLAEGMDITEDGEWTERSNGIYNFVSDLALYFAAESLRRPELLEFVRRNLRMMMYLVHPSGEVVTDYSGRQDFGHKFDLANYFLIYQLMAAHDKDPQFAAMMDYAGEFLRHDAEGNNCPVVGYMLYPSLKHDDIEREPLPDRYVKVFNEHHPAAQHLKQLDEVGHHMKIQHSSLHLAFGAPVARHRDGDTSVTVMSKAPSFFSLRHGKVRLLGVKLASSFSPGIVYFDEFCSMNGGYRLAATMNKGYNGPIPYKKLPSSPDREQMSPWYLLPHQYRPMTHLQQFRIEAFVTPGEGEWTIRVQSDEREDVFAQLTFVLGSEGNLSGGDIHSAGEDKFFLKSGAAEYGVGEDRVEVSSGAFEHRYPILREDHHPSGCKYVHVNLLTPFDRTFTVRLL